MRSIAAEPVYIDRPRPRAWRNSVRLAGQVITELIISEETSGDDGRRVTEFLLDSKITPNLTASCFLIRVAMSKDEMVQRGYRKGMFVRLEGLLLTYASEDIYIEAISLQEVTKTLYRDFNK